MCCSGQSIHVPLYRLALWTMPPSSASIDYTSWPLQQISLLAAETHKTTTIITPSIILANESFNTNLQILVHKKITFVLASSIHSTYYLVFIILGSLFLLFEPIKLQNIFLGDSEVWLFISLFYIFNLFKKFILFYLKKSNNLSKSMKKCNSEI